MIKEKINVSVGIAAYNEEKNIVKLLKSLLNQIGDNFQLKEIIIMSDGSTDRTVEEINRISDYRILLFDNKERKGQAFRIQEILNLFIGDTLLYIDADLYIKDKFFINNLVKQLNSTKKIGIVSPHLFPIKSSTFLGKAVNNYRHARESLSDEFDFGKTAFVAQSCMLYSRSLANEISFPQDLLNFDAYSYFSCLEKGYHFEWCRDVYIYYRSAESINEYVNQATRHLAGGKQLIRFFGEKIVTKHFTLPLKIHLKIMLYQIITNPIGYIYLKLFFLFSSLNSQKRLDKNKTTWRIIESSKSLL